MGKPTSFKSFMAVDTRPGEDELLKYRAQRRKRTDTEEAYENTMYCKKCGCERGDADPDCSCDMDNATLKDSQCYSEQSKCGSLQNEALNIQQRLQRSRSMKKAKARIMMGRRRAMRKMAPKDKLLKRARRAARNFLVKKLTKGQAKGELNFARRREIEKRVDKMGPRIDRLSKKMFPQIRKKEVARKKG